MEHETIFNNSTAQHSTAQHSTAQHSTAQQGIVSVVLPIYNVEKQLDRCIESVVNQTYKNLEIILVDDGSPDNCPQICDEWAKKDNRIRVIHKENAGAGMARNTGIDAATGEYICFFDSDDYVALDTVEKCYNLAKKENAEIVRFGSISVNSKNEVLSSFIPNPDKCIYEGDEVQNVLLPQFLGKDLKTGKARRLSMAAWAGMFSMELINKTEWRFVSERKIIPDDNFSLFVLFQHIKKVAIIPEALYYYFINENSISHTYRRDRFDKINLYYDECIRICEEVGYNDDVKNQLANPYMANTIGLMKLLESSTEDTKEKRKIFREIITDPHMQKVVSEHIFSGDTFGRRLLVVAIKFKLTGVARLFVSLKMK